MVQKNRGMQKAGHVSQTRLVWVDICQEFQLIHTVSGLARARGYREGLLLDSFSEDVDSL